MVSLDTGEYRIVLEGGTGARYSPTGHLVYAGAGSLLAVSFDLATLEVTSAPVPVTENVGMSFTSGHVEFGISDDGSLLYAPGSSRGDERTVVWVDREGRSEPIIETPRPFWQVRLSPDERSLAITLDGANISLWTYDLSRGTLTPLQSGFNNSHPTWSPDGRRLVFTSDQDGDASLYWITSDGSDQAERLSDAASALNFPQWPTSWSADGTAIAFWGDRPENRRGHRSAPIGG